MKNLILLLIFSIGIILFLNHCSSTEICSEPTESYAKMRFAIYGKGSDTTVYALTLSGTPPPDSNIYFYNNTKGVGTLNLPLDPTKDFCSFEYVFHIPDTVYETDPDTTIINIIDYPDQLTLYYKRILELVTPECGFGYSYSIDSILHSTTIIKSIEIINPVLTPENYGDFKIYI